MFRGVAVPEVVPETTDWDLYLFLEERGKIKFARGDVLGIEDGVESEGRTGRESVCVWASSISYGLGTGAKPHHPNVMDKFPQASATTSVVIDFGNLAVRDVHSDVRECFFYFLFFFPFLAVGVMHAPQKRGWWSKASLGNTSSS